MSTDLPLYRIYCNTEQTWTQGLLASIPTQCFNNPLHIVNANSVQIILAGNSLLNEGNYTITSSLDSSSNGTGALIVYGGLSVAKQARFGSQFVTGSATFSMGLDVNSSKIINCAIPSLPLDVANKLYVDSSLPPPPVELFVSSVASSENRTFVATTVSEMQITAPTAGIYKVDFSGQFVAILSNVTAQAVLDLNVLYNTIVGIANTSAIFPTFLTNTTITPGVYNNAAATSMAGNITFDGQGNNNSVFIFKINAACTAAASCTFILTNGAKADNIFFTVQGATSFGANASLAGTFISPAAAISTGAGAFVNGRLYSKNGAISISGSVQVPNMSYPFELGVLKSFVIFTSIGDVTNSGSNVIVGDIGTNNGIITGFTTVTMTGDFYLPGAGSSITNFGIYVNSNAKPSSMRNRVNCVNLSDVILADIVTVSANQIISIKTTNVIGSSIFYNRILSIRKFI